MNYKWDIEFENAGLTYPNGKEALKHINLKIKEGEMVAVIGLSGAGKTTLLKTLNKLQDITSGHLYVGDKSEEVLEEYKSKKARYQKELKKLEEFSANHKLTAEIVASYKKDLQEHLAFKANVIADLKKQVAAAKDDIKALEVEYAKAEKELSKKAAAPIKFQIKEKLHFIKTNEAHIARKTRKQTEREIKTNEILAHLKDWKANVDYINAKLEARLKTRVEFRKKDYMQSRKNKPYTDISKIKGREARKYKTHVGMVFQRYNLIYKASVFNNVMSGRLAQMPWWRAVTGIWSKEDKKIVFQALADVNMLEAAFVRAEDLSGGQMQRVALARTISQDARLILADEPVGALDPIMAKSIMDSFLAINQNYGKTVILNLHHVDLALSYADRIIGVKAGKIVFDEHAEKVNIKSLKQIYGDELEGFDAHELKEIMRKRKQVKG